MSTKPSTPFTVREMELINIAFQSLKEKPIVISPIPSQTPRLPRQFIPKF